MMPPTMYLSCLLAWARPVDTEFTLFVGTAAAIFVGFDFVAELIVLNGGESSDGGGWKRATEAGESRVWIGLRTLLT